MKEENKDRKAPVPGQKPIAAGTGAAAFRLTGFPKEFERNIWEDLDKRYVLIMLGSWIFVFGFAIMLQTMDYDQSALAAKARQNYLDKFYQAQIVSEPVAQEEETGAGVGDEEEAPKEEDARAERDRGRTAETRGPSAREIADQRRAAAAQRGAARREMENQIAGTGVLGLLSAAGGGGSGDAVVDVLGEAGTGTGDLGEVLSGVGGLATASASGQRSRLGSRGGGRVDGSADVNELLSGIGTAGSANIGRQGSISMALDAADVSGKGSKSANRSGEELSRVINSHNDAIEYCYKKESKLNPNLKGDIQVEFTVGFDGRVKSARIVRSSMRNKSVEDCISSRIRGWRFKPIDRKEGDVVVRQKYIFG
jgi:TonB family protein